MRIAQISPLIFPVPPLDHGGTERVICDLTNGLASRGHDVTLFAAEGSLTSATLVPQGACVASIENAPPSLPSAKECIMLDQVASRADEFDIIHCHTELYHAAVLRPWAKKLVMTIHWRADESDRQLYFDHFDQLNVVAISQSQARSLPIANCLDTVHHGIPKDQLRLGSGAGGYCAFLGRLTDQKRPDLAIEIAKQSGMEIRLGGTIDVGNPDYFETEVKPLLSNTSRYIGPVFQGDKQAFLGNASVFLFPIDWPEPFGLVMIEAMACGTPIIAWRNGSVEEVIEDGVSGFVVDSLDEAVAAVQKAKLLDRHKIRAAFEERFTQEHMVNGYLRAYEALHSKRWSRNFEPVVKVDRMTKEVIQNEGTEEQFT